MVLIATCTTCNYHYPLEAMGSPLYGNMGWYGIVPILKMSEPNRREEWSRLTSVAKLYTAGVRRQLKQYKGSCANSKHPTTHPIPKMTQEQPSEHRTAAQSVGEGEMKSSSCMIGTHNLTPCSQPQQFSGMTDTRSESSKALWDDQSLNERTAAATKKLVQHRMIRQENAQRHHREGKKGKRKQSFRTHP